MLCNRRELVVHMADMIRECGDGTLADAIMAFAKNSPKLARDDGYRWSLVGYDPKVVKDRLKKHMGRRPSRDDLDFAMGFLETCADNMGDDDDDMFWASMVEAMEYEKRHG